MNYFLGSNKKLNFINIYNIISSQLINFVLQLQIKFLIGRYLIFPYFIFDFFLMDLLGNRLVIFS